MLNLIITIIAISIVWMLIKLAFRIVKGSAKLGVKAGVKVGVQGVKGAKVIHEKRSPIMATIAVIAVILGVIGMLSAILIPV